MHDLLSKPASVQVQYSSMRQLLRCAEDAAAVAAAECEGLVGVVQALIDQESRVRSAHAHRALELREALQHTHAALRRAAKDRVAQNEVRVLSAVLRALPHVAQNMRHGVTHVDSTTRLVKKMRCGSAGCPCHGLSVALHQGGCSW
jgi:hypothetical protein